MIAALALAMTACSAPEATPEAAPRVSVVTVGPQVVQRDDELPGRVAAVRTAQIRAQVGGIVQRRLFEQGAEVRAGQAYAWVIGGDGKAVIRTLEVDGSVDRQWLVRTGLKAGEKVVVEGQERLQEGVVVDARDWQMPVASAGAVQAGSKG